MIAKFILIVVYASGYGPRSYPVALGEYNNVAACQRASVEVYKAFQKQDFMGGLRPQMVCVAKD